MEAEKGADGKKHFKGNSTVSRYACRIQCERKPPYSARLYAAAFDEHGRIQLSVSLLFRIRFGCAIYTVLCNRPLLSLISLLGGVEVTGSIAYLCFHYEALG